MIPQLFHVKHDAFFTHRSCSQFTYVAEPL